MTDAPPPAIPAATLIVLRPRPTTAPDILMVERSAAMAFAPGSLVFPGGRVEAADRMAGWLGEPDDGAARGAAIRETIEEAGVAIGIDPPPDAATIDRWRSQLIAGAPLAELIAAAGARIDRGALTAFARWRPSHRPVRVYDTRFYLARWPEGASAPRVDGTENVRAFWASACDTLAAVAEGRARAIFPTMRVLERLARFDSVDEVFTDADAYPPMTIVPWVEQRGGIDHFCIPDGLGYPITVVAADSSDRG